MPRVGGKRKKTRTHKEVTEGEYDSVPKSIVMKRNELTKDMKHLEQNLRDLMYPFTAMKFKETTKLKMKEIMFACRNFGVSHIFFLSSHTSGNYLKLLKTPKGPTFTFKIDKYSLNNDL